MTNLIVCLGAGLVALFVTYLVRANARRTGLIQLANDRSSHVLPTPTGGGLGIVAGGTLCAGWLIGPVDSTAWFIVLCGLAIAMLGLWDDAHPLDARWRLLVQAVLVGIVVVFAVPFAPLSEAVGLPLPQAVLVGLLILAGVYWINLFNFMDGIDGLAGSQAVFMLLAAAGLALGFAPDAAHDPLFWWMVGLASATGGFLILNWPPARIFMGDAGSTFLGLMIGALALLSIASGWLSAWQWLILGGLFIVDASVTLGRRLLNGEKVFEAHRRHAYQFLARKHGAHLPVTLTYLGINVMFVWPMAYWAGREPAIGALVALIAYAALATFAISAGAGRPEVKA